MKHIKVDFQARVRVLNMIASLSSLSVPQMSAFSKLWEALKLTESDNRLLTVTDRGDGTMNCQAKTDCLEFLSKELSIEDTDAAILSSFLENYSGYTVADASWFPKLKADLTTSLPSPPPSPNANV